MLLTIKPMSADDIRAMIAWQYEADYAMYNVPADDIEAEVRYMQNPSHHYYGIYAGDDLIGHCVFHAEARVPGGDYPQDALDIGAGIRPDWTGQGKGTSIIGEILKFGHKQYQATAFRASIAAWNLRAQKATMANGFVEVSRFKHTTSGMEFIVFYRDTPVDG